VTDKPPRDADERRQPPWRLVAKTAARQGRAVGLAQLRAAGLTRHEISRAALAGHIHGYHRSVYAVGTPELSAYGRLWAGHLAVGEDSRITSHSAGQLWAMRPWQGDVHVIAPKDRRHHRGVVVHRGILTPDQMRRRRGLPLVSPARALLDMAVDLRPDALQIAINQGLSNSVLRLRDIDAVLLANPGHHGLGALGEALQAQRDDPGTGRTRSEMEALFLTLLRKLPNLPPHKRNATLHLADDVIVSPDVLFTAERVWIELDSRRWHEQKLTMDADRRKDQRALAFGYAPFRFTWRHLTREWAEVSCDLLETLARRGGRRTAA
jgi:hypothetical protein